MPDKNDSPHPTEFDRRERDANSPPLAIVLGAGITGLTVAHELIERGFDVQIVEQKARLDAEYEVEVGGLAANQIAVVKAAVEVLHPHLHPYARSNYLHQVRERRSIVDEDVESGPNDPNQERSQLAALRSLPMQHSDRPTRLDAILSFRNARPHKAKKEIKKLRKHIAGAPDKKLVKRFLATTDRHGRSNEQKLDLLGRRIACALLRRAQRLAEDIVQAEEHSGRKLKGQLDEATVRREIMLIEVTGHVSPDVANPLAEPLSQLRAQFVRLLLLEHRFVGAHLEKESPALDAALRLIADGRPRAVSEVTRDEEFPYAKAFIAKLSRHLVARGRGATEPLGMRPPLRRLSGRVSLDPVEVRLPGDHGYRFFPAFYRHLFDTMNRTPILVDGEESGETTFDRLVEPSPVTLRLPVERPAEETDEPWPSGRIREVQIPRRHETVEQLRRSLAFLLGELGLSTTDLEAFVFRLVLFLTSSKQRRESFEEYSWIEFLDGIRKDQRHDPEYEMMNLSEEAEEVIRSTLRTLLAMDGEEIDAHSYGVNSLQLLLEAKQEAVGSDMTLNGPTSDVWLRPWKEYLKQQGVQFFSGLVLELRKKRAKSDELVPFVIGHEHPELQPDREWEDPREREERLHEKLQEAGRYFAPVPEDPNHRYFGWIPGEDSVANPRPPDFYVLALPFEAASRLAWKANEAGFPLNGDWQQLGKFDALHMERDEDGWDRVQFGPENDRVYGTLRERETGRPDISVGGQERAGQTRSSGYPLRDFAGVQFYWANATRFGKGHLIYPRSPWGLSAISQMHHWRDRRARSEGFLGQFSIDLGDFYRRWRDAPSAWRSERLAIPLRSWEQIVETLEPALAKAIASPRYVHIDDGIVFAQPRGDAKCPSLPASNLTPFLINLPGQFAERPGQVRPPASESEHPSADASLIMPEISNGRWVLAGTYMATHTRIMTMEASNESGRHAVRTILHAIMVETRAPGEEPTYNSQGQLLGALPDVWDPYECEIEDLRPLKELDAALFAEGLPHVFEILGFDTWVSLRGKRRRRPVLPIAEKIKDQIERNWGFLNLEARRAGIPPTPAEMLEAIMQGRGSSAVVEQTLELLKETGLDGPLQRLFQGLFDSSR